jgi:hemerythrin
MHEMKEGLERRQIQAALNLMKFYKTWLHEHTELEDSKYESAIRDAVLTGRLPGQAVPPM